MNSKSAMTPEEFLQAGHTLIGRIVDYRNDLDKRPVRAQVGPGEALWQLIQQRVHRSAG